LRAQRIEPCSSVGKDLGFDIGFSGILFDQGIGFPIAPAGAAVVLVLLGGTTWVSGGFWAPDGTYSRVVSPVIGLAWVVVASGNPFDPKSWHACGLVTWTPDWRSLTRVFIHNHVAVKGCKLGIARNIFGAVALVAGKYKLGACAWST
jgi:hypothetical protein